MPVRLDSGSSALKSTSVDRNETMVACPDYSPDSVYPRLVCALATHSMPLVSRPDFQVCDWRRVSRSDYDAQGERVVRNVIPTTVTHQPPDVLEASCTNRPPGSPPYARTPLPRVVHFTGEKAGLSDHDEPNPNTTDTANVPGRACSASYLGKALRKKYPLIETTRPRQDPEVTHRPTEWTS